MFTSLPDELITALKMLALGIAVMTGSAVICIPLSRRFPYSKTQATRRDGMVLDATYQLLDSVSHRPVIIGFTYLLMKLFQVPESSLHGIYKQLAALPLLVQYLLVILIIDFLRYWVHRAMHYKGFLWKIHSIHHSSTDLDWLSNARMHPLNSIIYSILPVFLVQMLAFRPEVFLLYSAIMAIYSPLLHSNLNWTFGPFRYLIGSPVYHRYHHSITNLNKNLAFYFPFIDIIFGTFYMPDNNSQIKVGTTEPVPQEFWTQLLYPFLTDSTKKKKALS